MEVGGPWVGSGTSDWEMVTPTWYLSDAEMWRGVCRRHVWALSCVTHAQHLIIRSKRSFQRHGCPREPWLKSDGCKEGRVYGSIGVLTFVTGEVKQSSLRGAEYIPTCADVESITGTPKRARR